MSSAPPWSSPVPRYALPLLVEIWCPPCRRFYLGYVVGLWAKVHGHCYRCDRPYAGDPYPAEAEHATTE